MRKLFNKWLDKQIFKKIVKADFGLNESDKKYLQKLSKDKNFIDILDKIATAVIYTSLSVKSEEGIAERDAWVKCIGYIKAIIQTNEPLKNIDRLTNERLSDQMKRR